MKIQHYLNIIAILLLSMVNSFTASAQEAAPKVEMATKFYGEGKIYIVIAVLVIIFVGIVLYLINLDKKITKIEKELH